MGEKVANQNVYKPEDISNDNILPGELKRSPDDSFSRTIIFIDSGFLSKLSKYFGNGKYLRYDLIQFCKNLAKNQSLICEHMYYYTSPPFQSNNPSHEESERHRKYENFKNTLSQNEIISIKEGRCQRIECQGKFSFGQKGVDALVIIDLLTIPTKEKIKKIILIANDSDFVPVINKLKELGNEVILYTYYSKKRGSSFARSNELLQAVSRYVRLTKQDFDNAPLT